MIRLDNELLVAVSKRNPGALRVCFEIADQTGEVAIATYAMLLGQKIGGSDLWDLYKACNHSVTKMHECLRLGKAIELLQTVRGSSFYEESRQA